jgi:hypothetical protein
LHDIARKTKEENLESETRKEIILADFIGVKDLIHAAGKYHWSNLAGVLPVAMQSGLTHTVDQPALTGNLTC